MEKNYIHYNNMIKQKIDGFYDIESDALAIEAFKLEVKSKSMYFHTYLDKIKYLIAQKYYVDFLSIYTEEQIKEIHDLVLSYNFEFKSFMAIQKFYLTYALRTLDKQHFLETYEDRIVCVSLFLASGDFTSAKDMAKLMIKQVYQPATPTFLNSGKLRGGELISCFLLEMDDSLNSINYNLSTAMQLSKIGGGVAIDLTNLRARGENIQGIKGISRGVLPVMKLYEDAFNYVDQLGQRQGAGAVYLNIFHSDIIEFLDTKKINSDEKNRIQTLSIGVKIPDYFMELAKKNEVMYLFKPHSIYEKYNLKFEDINFELMYDTLVKDPDIEKIKVTARDMLTRIAITQFESGYPYLMFVDNANKAHALNATGKIKLTNLCTEIFQLSTPSTINNYGEEDAIGYDICCNLGSLNIVNLVENNNYEDDIYHSTMALNYVSEQSHINQAPGVNKANKDFHPIGLGVMNLHGFLAKNFIPYESEDAKDFVNTFFMLLNYYSLQASCKIAMDKKKTFVGFETSTYKTGHYFEQYITKEYKPQSEKIKNIFKDTMVPGIKEWNELKLLIQENGLYNAYRLAIAPTQSISYIQNATASIMPIVDLIETRIDGKSQTYYPMPYLNRNNIFSYKSAYNMNQEKIIDLIALMQPHIDQGISTVLYVTNENSTRDLARLYYYAWAKGLKSLYYIRTKNLTLNECETCSV